MWTAVNRRDSIPAHRDMDAVKQYLLDLQDRLCSALEEEDGTGRFKEKRLQADRGVQARPRHMSQGKVFERAAVNFSHSVGGRLPGAATTERRELAGVPFEAVSLSLIVHPLNPYVPTAHANLRYFVVKGEIVRPPWWFGGGSDLTPYYGFTEDAVHWHRTARSACEPFAEDMYRHCKEACDRYFFLAHRGEARGVGGIFFDDLNEGGFERCFAFVRSVGDRFLPAYQPIVQRRKDMPYGTRQREFQLYRRGRYVEFNLIYDRGTRFGLQSGKNVESILASLPPLAQWRYDWQPEPGSEESRLYEEFLRPRDWLTDGGN